MLTEQHFNYPMILLEGLVVGTLTGLVGAGGEVPVGGLEVDPDQALAFGAQVLLGDGEVVDAVATAFQDRKLTTAVEQTFGTKLSGSSLRIEYAQDVDGFWLEPHTDLGVKLFTLLIYLSADASHADLGTDIYDTEKKHVARSPFAQNAAMVFVPSNITFHGFEKRPIQGVRKSVIINYVTNEWRAREQLAFPASPIVA